MKKIIFKIALFAAVSFSAPVLLSSCDKNDDGTSASSSAAKEYFTNNMANRELVVPLATDNAVNITSKFDGLIFTFTDTTTYAGTATASNSILTVRGTWSIDAGYDNITFNFPTNIIADLAFVNKQWHFINRDSTTIKLGAVTEADVIYFSRK